MSDSELIHKGHRQRMRDRFITHGSRVMHTYELLEMLLYNVVAYKDTNPIAKRLINRFKSVDGVFLASKEELMSVEGVGERIADFILKCAALVDEGYERENVRIFDDHTYMGSYIAEKLSEYNGHKIAVFLFDNKMRMIGEKVVYDYDFSSGAVKAEPFVNLALENGASIVALAHTHPHGPLFPSVGDMATNTMISSALFNSGITQAEHFIISGKKFYGITKSISFRFGQSPELDRFYRSKEHSENGEV